MVYGSSACWCRSLLEVRGKSGKLKQKIGKNWFPCNARVCALHRSPARTRTPPTGVRTRYLHRPGRPIHASTASSFRTALVGRRAAGRTTYSSPVSPHPHILTSPQYQIFQIYNNDGMINLQTTRDISR